MKKKEFWVILCLVFFLLPLIGGKKISFEVFIGGSIPNYKNLYLSEKGVDNYLKSYADYLNLSLNEVDDYKPVNTSALLSFTTKYPIDDNFSIRGSIEYNSGSSSGEKTYTLNWPQFQEQYKYSNGYKIVSVLPMLGIEYQIGKLAFYIDGGINIGDISHTTEVSIAESGVIYIKKNTFKGVGTGLALSVGSKYYLKIDKIGTLIFKAEIFLSSINSIPGTMDKSWVNPVNGNGSTSEEGKFYIFDTNPYNTGWFQDMKFYKVIPSPDGIKNIEEFSLNFSSIKLSIGYSF